MGEDVNGFEKLLNLKRTGRTLNVSIFCKNKTFFLNTKEKKVFFIFLMISHKSSKSFKELILVFMFYKSEGIEDE